MITPFTLRPEPNAMGIHPGPPPPPGHPMFDARNGNIRPNLEDDPVIRQLLQNNEKPPNLKP